MSFGKELYEEFSNIMKNKDVKVGEKVLFEALEHAFTKISIRNLVKCRVIHGTKYLVGFDEIEEIPFYYSRDLGKKVKCELADLLIVVLNGEEMRVSCLQNKYEKSGRSSRNCFCKFFYGLCRNYNGFYKFCDGFYADMRQFYLLEKRPVFEINGNESTLLNEAICPSVGSYGVFYKENSGYNMAYSSAGALETSKNFGGRIRKVFLKNCGLKLDYYINSFGQKVLEQQYSEDMVDFGDGLVKMLIGTPFTIKTGLSVLGDKEIFDAVVKMTDKKDKELENIGKSIEAGGARVYYRSAVVIKSEFEGNNYEFIDIKNIID